tara:strand:+ start:612 stop:947 length:336 start_codon:yes stop_codon:yes gene_type:complete
MGYSEERISRAGGRQSRDFPEPDYEQDSPYEREPRLDLVANGYEYDYHNVQWWKVIGCKKRRARVDHKDGTVCAGEAYWEYVVRAICDETSEQCLSRTKQVITKEEEVQDE